MYSVCTGAGEKGESVLVVYRTLMIGITLPRKKNFYKRNGFPYPDPSKKKLIFAECDYFRIRT